MARDYRLRIDPWAADYDGTAGMLEAEAPDARVELGVEGPWQALRPGLPKNAPHLAFVDGVRRIECRFVVERGGRAHFGLFGSFAVGAALANGRARVLGERIGRIAACSGGFAVEPVRLRIGGMALHYEPEAVADDRPDAPLRGLQNAMRRAEAELGPELLQVAELVLLDGPLSSLSADGPLVGYVKRLLRSYLPPAEAELLPRLRIGERTPLFLVRSAPQDRYSWYQRIGEGRAHDSAWAGIVRCETGVRPGLDEARRLADLTAACLPHFASDPLRDPRAPQNLFPIGALEGHLRHRLGDPLLLRRALEASVLGESAA